MRTRGEIIKLDKVVMAILAIALVMICLGAVSASSVDEVNATLEAVNDNSQETIVIDKINEIPADEANFDSYVSVENEKRVLNKNVLKASDEDVLGDDVPQIRDKNSGNTEVTVSAGTSITIEAYMTYDDGGYMWGLQKSSDSSFSTKENINYYQTGHAYWHDFYTTTLNDEGTFYFRIHNYNDRYGINSEPLIYHVGGSSSNTKETAVSITIPSTGTTGTPFTVSYSVTEKDSTTGVDSGTLTFYDENGQIGSPVTLSSSSGTFSHTYSTANTYNIYAKYTASSGYEDSQSSSSQIIISDSGSEPSGSEEIILSFEQGTTSEGTGYLYSFNNENAWVSVVAGNNYPTYVNFAVDYGTNYESSPVIQWKKSTDSAWNDISYTGNRPRIGFSNGKYTDVTYADGYTYDVRVSNGGKTSNTLTVKCIQGYTDIYDFDCDLDEGDEGQTIQVKFKPTFKQNSEYPFVQGYVSFFSSESRDASSRLGTIHASSSSELDNGYIVGQITLPLVDSTGEYDIYYVFVGQAKDTYNGLNGYNDLYNFKITINDVAQVAVTPEIAIEVNASNVLQSEKVKVNVTVSNEGTSINEGQVAFYYYGETTPIATVDLASKDYIEIDTSALTVGTTYTVLAKYLGVENKYNPKDSETGTFTVVVKPEISLTPSEALTIRQGQSETLTPSISPEVTSGSITYFDGDEEIEGLTDVEYNTPFTTGALSVGIHSISVKYNGASGFLASEKSAPVNVIVNPSTGFVIDIANRTYGEHSIATITVAQAGEYTIVISDIESPFTKTFADAGTDTIDLGVLKASDLYTATLKFGDEVLNTTKFNVTKKTPTEIRLNSDLDENPVEDTANKISATVWDGQSQITVGTITFKEEGKSDVERAIGAEYDLTDLSVGTHIITVEFSGNDNYTVLSSEKTITVKEIITPNIALQVNESNVIKGNKVKLNVTVANGESVIREGQVAFYYAGQTTPIDTVDLASKDYIEIDTSDLTVGTSYTVLAKYLGVKNKYNPKESETRTFSVVEPPVLQTLPLTLTIEGKTSINVTHGIYYELYAESTIDNVALKLYDRSDEVSGNYKTNTAFNLYWGSEEVGMHDVYVVFEGNQTHQSAESHVSVKVYPKATSTLHLELTPNNSVEGNVVDVTAKVYYESGSDKVYLTEGILTLYSSYNDWYNNENAIATLNIKDSGSFSYNVPSATDSPSSSNILYGDFEGINGEYYYVTTSYISDSFYSIKPNTVSLELSSSEVTSGESVTLTVTVSNYKTLSEDSLVRVYVDNALKGSFETSYSYGYYNLVNTYSLDTTGLSDGEHSIYVKYDGIVDRYFYYAGNSSEKLSLNVISSTPVVKTISISSDEIDYNTKATLTVTGTAGTYTVTVNGHDYDVTVPDSGSATVLIDEILAANTTAYGVSIVSTTDSTLNNVSTLLVKAISPGLSVSSTKTSITYGEAITISADKNSQATGDVKFYEGASEINVNNVVLTAGSHTITAKYAGNGNYSAEDKSITINVAKATNNVVITAGDVTLPSDVSVSVKADIAGTYIVKFDSTHSVSVTVSSNGATGSQTISLPAGSYTPSIIGYSDDNYEASVTASRLTVSNQQETPAVVASLKIRDADSPSNTTITISGEGNITINLEYYVVKPYDGATVEYIAFNVNGETKSIDHIVNGAYTKVSFTVNETSTFTLSAYYFAWKLLENECNVTSNSLTYNILVKNQTVSDTVTISVSDVIYPNNATGIVKSTVDGDYIVNVNNKDYEVKVANGTSSVTFDVLVPGEYKVTVISKANAGIKSIASFKVEKISDFEMNCQAVNATAGNTKLIAVLADGAKGSVSLSIGNKTYNSSVENGKATVDLSDLKAGSYIVQTSYSGDDIYSNKTSTDIIYISGTESDSTIIASDMKRGYNSGMDFNATFKDLSGNILSNANVTFVVENQTFSLLTDANGVARFNNSLDVGSYSITLINPATGEIKNANLTIVARLIGNVNITGDYLSCPSYIVQAFGDDGLPVGEGEIVNVVFAGKTYSIKTNATGHAVRTIGLAPGLYGVYSIYEGYKTDANVIHVTQILKSSNVNVKKSASKLTLKATLKSSDGKALAGKKLTFTFKGKTYSAKTDAKGIAKVVIKKNVIKKLKAGSSYKFKVKYVNDSISKIVKVKK